VLLAEVDGEALKYAGTAFIALRCTERSELNDRLQIEQARMLPVS
jgi:hypothetical protein